MKFETEMVLLKVNKTRRMRRTWQSAAIMRTASPVMTSAAAIALHGRARPATTGEKILLKAVNRVDCGYPHILICIRLVGDH